MDMFNSDPSSDSKRGRGGRITPALTDEQVIEVFEAYAEGATLEDLLDRFECSRPTLYKVLARKSYKHVAIPGPLLELASRRKWQRS